VLAALLALAGARGSLPGPGPARAGRRGGSFGSEDDRELGQKYHPMIRAQYPVVEDPEIVAYVRDLVDRLYAQLPPQPFPANVTVIRNSAINAFATPGGYVYVFTGLITDLEHEDELAGVLAHELGHVSQRHVAKRIEQMQNVQLGMLAGMLAGMFLGTAGGGTNMGEASEALLIGSMAAGTSAMLNYSRIDEREADQVGMNFLVAAGFQPEGMIGAFQKIRRKQYLAGSSVPQYLSTHPDVAERIGYLQDRVNRLTPEVRERPHNDTRFVRVKTLVRARHADPEAAMGAFVQGDGDPALLAMGRGIVLSRAQPRGRGRGGLRRGPGHFAEDPLVLREAGAFHYRSGDAAKAGRYLTKASILNPKDLMALFYLGRLQADAGQTARAVEYFRRVLDTLPEDAEVHYHLGRTLGESGDTFAGHLHLAYSGIYGLDRKQADFNLKKAQALAKTEAQKKDLEKLEEVYKSRAEFWKGGA
jgi:predicted Zn-dependent protease